MTQEEAIKILNGYMCGKIDPESTELYQAIEFVFDILESQPSLPSDLDEAADAHIRRVADAGWEWTTQDIAEAFKAGAEWMAGQGVQDSIEGTICGRVYDHVNVKFPDGIGETLEPKSVSHIPANVKNYNIGDEVIIQIRKKVTRRKPKKERR